MYSKVVNSHSISSSHIEPGADAVLTLIYTTLHYSKVRVPERPAIIMVSSRTCERVQQRRIIRNPLGTGSRCITSENRVLASIQDIKLSVPVTSTLLLRQFRPIDRNHAAGGSSSVESRLRASPCPLGVPGPVLLSSPARATSTYRCPTYVYRVVNGKTDRMRTQDETYFTGEHR